MDWFDLAVSLVIILISAELFTNGIEWVGENFGLSEGAVGSVLAAVGTALPETILPLVAIAVGGVRAGKEVGIGAILGAPLMLSTVGTVFNRIVKSLSSDQPERYSVSRATTSSKLVMRFRPATCHGPVMPGFMSNLV